MDSMIRRELSARAFPGAAFLCGTADQTLYTHNYGDLDYTHTVPVTDSTLYDVASCTKVLSTTFVLMRLYDQKKISLERTVGEFLPRFAGTPLTTLTIQELLTHTSGLKPTVVYPDLIKPAHGGKLFRIPSISPEFPGPVTGRSQIRCGSIRPSIRSWPARLSAATIPAGVDATSTTTRTCTCSG